MYLFYGDAVECLTTNHGVVGSILEHDRKFSLRESPGNIWRHDLPKNIFLKLFTFIISHVNIYSYIQPQRCRSK